MACCYTVLCVCAQGFTAYCAYFHTNRSAIAKAYKAARDAAAVLPPGARPYMVPGTVSSKRGVQDDTYSTTMEIVGMQQAPETEEVSKASRKSPRVAIIGTRERHS